MRTCTTTGTAATRADIRWPIRSMSRTRVKMECQDRLDRLLACVECARAGGTRAPAALVRRRPREAPCELSGHGAGRHAKDLARPGLGERMPRKKGHKRGAGKHATGQRKSKGANLAQVLWREARKISKIGLVGPASSASAAPRAETAPQMAGRVFYGCPLNPHEVWCQAANSSKSLSILLWASRFVAK